MVLTRRLIANLVVFALVSTALIAYGLVDLLGNPFASPMTISTVMPTAAGLHPGFSVTLNGVDVGSVSSVELVKGGARVVMSIDRGVSIPSDVQARVDLANALGEQQVDLIPAPSADGAQKDPPLRNGATVPLAPDGAPQEVSQVVATATRLLQAIPAGALNNLLSELATALKGQAANLQTITDSSKVFAEEFLAYQSQFKALLANAPPVLDTIAGDGPALRQALANTAVIAHVFAEHRQDVVDLLNSGSVAFGDLGTIVARERPNLACLTHDLAALNTNLEQPANLRNLDVGLQDNTFFWNLIPLVAKDGNAKGLFPGEPDRPNQPWLRTELLIPPVQPTPLSYATAHTLPPTKPGAACVTSLGEGVGPATQPGYHTNLPESRLVPPSSSDAYVPGSQASGGGMSASGGAGDGAPRGAVGNQGTAVLRATLRARAQVDRSWTGR